MQAARPPEWRGVRSELPYPDGARCALDEARRHGAGHAQPVEAGKREVGDLDDTLTIGRCDETAGADDGVGWRSTERNPVQGCVVTPVR